MEAPMALEPDEGNQGVSDYRLREGWFTVVLLLMMLLCLAWSIAVADWVPGLPVLVWVALAGGVLGILLAKNRLPAWMSHALSALAGFTWGAWLTSRVLVAEMHLPGSEALLELDWRLQAWVGQLIAEGQSSVAHILLFVLCLLLWLIAYVSALAVFRWHRPWWAVIACSLAILINITSAPSHQTWFLLSFLLLALLLIVRTSLAAYEQEWRTGRVQYAPEVVAGFLRAGLTVAVLALTLAWLVPAGISSGRFQATWEKVRDPWLRLQQRWEVAFQDINSREVPPAVLVRKGMTFGGPVTLTDKPIMDIEAAGGRYWRSQAFDTYLGYGWLNTDAETLALGADGADLLLQPSYAERQVLTQTVTLRQDLGMGHALVAAGDPLRVSVEVQAVVSPLTPTLTVEAPQLTLSSGPAPLGASLLYLKNGLRSGASYWAVSSVSAVTAESLRGAGTGYPEWVQARYLQLPDTLPSRVRRLSEEITAGLSAPYDKVIAVEAYLRKIPYTQQIPGPEPEQDGVDYFLFEEQRGYCSYYASSMVVLLRAAGVPARYVEGFGRGQAVQGVYHILEKDGHAWPEVFFPGYGWVEFEPTAAQALTSRSPKVTTTAEAAGLGLDRQLPQMDDEVDPALRDGGFGPPAAVARVPFWRRLPGWAWGVLAAALLLTAGIGSLVARQRRRMLTLTPAERAYYRLSRGAGRLLRLRPLDHQTPLEYGRAVASAVPAGRDAALGIAEFYVAERFGARTEAAGAGEAWIRFRPLLWRRWLDLKVETARRALRRLLRPRGRRAPQPGVSAAD
jgi:transglutaminase-like putative cysteine protease